MKKLMCSRNNCLPLLFINFYICVFCFNEYILHDKLVGRFFWRDDTAPIAEVLVLYHLCKKITF